MFGSRGDGSWPAPAATEPAPEDWRKLGPRAVCADAPVDVIVPVYGGRAETLRCIYQVLASRNETRFELIVVDDASPDGVLSSQLQNLASQLGFRVLVNERNVGFSASVNRAMRMHPERDAVLLNADTMVFGDWLDRLRRAILAGPRIATVTPLSNNATILSYPLTLQDNADGLELDPAALDALAAATCAPPIEIPTAIGFCMYVRRACLAEIGYFDERNFGGGYGEENDFSRRAVYAQWNHVAAADTYVHHFGARSFGARKRALVQQAMRNMERLHPGYDKLIARFIQIDPLAPVRRRLDERRMAPVGAWQKLVVGDGHAPIGPHGHPLRLVAGARGRRNAFRFTKAGVSITPNLPWISPDDPTDKLAEALRNLQVGEIDLATAPRHPLANVLVKVARATAIQLTSGLRR